MEKEIIKPKTVQTKKEYKFKISYSNGANETIIPSMAPSLDPQIPMFMNFLIKSGNIRQVNLAMVRYMDVEITESTDFKLIT
jgi:hypothetical protein